MAETTPGPWELVTEDQLHDADVVRANGVFVAKTRARLGGDNGGHNRADGHLIAAAPDLLEALKWAEAKMFALGREFASPRFTDRHGDGPELLKLAEMARAALAKAEGR